VRKSDPSNVRDTERAFVAPYLTLMTADAPQRALDRRALETLQGLRLQTASFRHSEACPRWRVTESRCSQRFSP
jgi:hypothetical protein